MENVKNEIEKKLVGLAMVEKKYPIEREVFANYCDSQIKSITVAINKKLNGSDVEELYFIEHAVKLLLFFLEHKIREA